MSSVKQRVALAEKLRQIAREVPEHAETLTQAASALYRASATIALVKGAIKGD